ncbi:MAG: hypothetical protein WED05_08945 [Candidatus Atabeyarchaeum deiterrae]
MSVVSGSFLDDFCLACQRIGSDYFDVPMKGGKPKYLERVYCYELYHRLRSCSRLALSPVTLFGEPDKSAYRRLSEKVRAKKPDLIFHVPGEARNLIVIEVKPAKMRRNGLWKDINTLSTFLSDVDTQYLYGIMLVYGALETGGLPWFVKIDLRNLAGDYANRILLLWHAHPGEKPSLETW